MAPRITTAFVLAAGLGTRMRPITERMPKPMVALAGRPLIDHVLERLAAAGIERAIVNVHHHADLLERHLKSRSEPPRVEISDERGVLLDTGGGAAKALPLLGSEPFLIHNSDSVWLEGPAGNIPRMLDMWDGARMDSLMLLAQVTQSLGYDGAGDFAMAPDGRLARRGEGLLVPFAFAGVSIAHPRLFERAPQGRFSLNTLWNRAIDAGRLYGLRLDGLWMHVGSPEALAQAEARIATEDSP